VAADSDRRTDGMPEALSAPHLLHEHR
jgi:hypothetical protein